MPSALVFKDGPALSAPLPLLDRLATELTADLKVSARTVSASAATGSPAATARLFPTALLFPTPTSLATISPPPPSLPLKLVVPLAVRPSAAPLGPGMEVLAT